MAKNSAKSNVKSNTKSNTANKNNNESTYSQEELKKEIKKMEAEKREEAASKARKTQEKKEEKITYDAWWAKRSEYIPQGHQKEIVLADFKGRGLSEKELASEYDKALKLYGIDLGSE